MSESDKRIATFVVPYTAGILEAVASSGGQEVARKRLVTAGTPVALRLRPYKATVTTSRDDLAYVVVEVVDFSGNLVPDAVLKVQFDVSGGTLAGVINGNVHNPDSMQRPRRWTYHGKALAVIRPPKSAGTISVTAFGENLQGTTLSIPAVDGTFPAL
jgi:beta-galactosidase